MEGFIDLSGRISGFIWGLPMLTLITCTGIYLGIKCGFPQIRHFFYAMKNTFGQMLRRDKADKGSVTPVQAVATAMGATVGTGNVVGVTWALTMGGPGAVFWMWVSALIGMCTKYAEIVLSVRFREKNAQGEWVGGPMHYIIKGLGKSWRWLAVMFALLCMGAALGMGNIIQAGNIASSVNTTISSFTDRFIGRENEINLAIGIIVAGISAFVIFGGMKRVGKVMEFMIPAMALLIIICSTAVIAANAGKLAAAFGEIFRHALKPEAAAGGISGMAVRGAMSWGFRRGIFSNEAGLGSAPLAHGATSEKDPVKQGLFGIFEVFVSTIVLCTLTALTLLVSGIDLSYGAEGGIALNVAAFATVFGHKAAGVIIMAAIILFAISTMFGWALYGSRCAEFVFGPESVKTYRICFILIIVAGATMDLRLAWDVSDILNALMAVPNLIALIGLSGVVSGLTRQHFKAAERKSAAKAKKRGIKINERV